MFHFGYIPLCVPDFLYVLCFTSFISHFHSVWILPRVYSTLYLSHYVFLILFVLLHMCLSMCSTTCIFYTEYLIACMFHSLYVLHLLCPAPWVSHSLWVICMRSTPCVFYPICVLLFVYSTQCMFQSFCVSPGLSPSLYVPLLLYFSLFVPLSMCPTPCVFHFLLVPRLVCTPLLHNACGD